MYSYSPHQGYTRYPSLENASVFITGGATGIGAALVEAFAAQGAQVAFVDLDDAEALSLCDQLVAKGYRRPWYRHCDVSDISALKATIVAAGAEQGDIRVLINNAANDQRYDTRSLSEELWYRGLAVNLHPAFFAAQTVQPMMARLGGGSIINISSINTEWAPPQLASYITAKAGILGISKSLATDFGEDNIRVNAILPGWVATPKQLEKWLSVEEEHELMKRVCLKKRLGAHDVAKLALFLAADDAAMITAQEFVIDGGRI
ncbi:SDR family NAD(P)-dependent oxidoreductase [Cellvibrio japonicus]|uniref:Short chain dehydrogenase/reductase n=1 Tax=Cellvibrio japonicus (strain Ueda107) TaxID=498211 RepID=B3PBK9_CELJU|nr:SDR family oxidoreductase [Cellvibrio japonicus]ACE85247.1 short chain dehydrogenase/reductase [Cellvibrio japonicus Ueda107]QEI13122.1 SDR family oxidoreductase [Cellvibrio japonicus]QEI16696.1 SDR family oxidoreductase [Cellvibrio japonicus]QEI20274.1 SDR family oxidoreductase [Cellvibrio japonicus]